MYSEQVQGTPTGRRVATYVSIVRHVPASGAESSTPSSGGSADVVSTFDPLATPRNDGITHAADVDTSQVNMELNASTSDALCLIENTPELVVPVIEPSRLPINSHLMVTCAKAGIFKPKALVIEVLEFEPRMIEKTFATEEWHAVAQAEYDALLRNHTWELISLPLG